MGDQEQDQQVCIQWRSGNCGGAKERKGGDTDVDISYQYLTFLEDDAKLAKIKQDYTSGELLFDTSKKELIDILQPMVAALSEGQGPGSLMKRSRNSSLQGKLNF